MEQRNNRMVMLLIAGIPVTMILAASWLWYFVVRGDLDLVSALGTANRGTLVNPPRQLDDAALRDRDGRAMRMPDLEPKWRLLVPQAGADCDANCEHRLYLTRQIHIAMGKEFNRIGRLYVSTEAVTDTNLSVPELSDQRPAPASFKAYLDTEHRGLKALQLPAADYNALFPEQMAAPDTWYLVDPAGWIMMSYTPQISYKDVMADLKFLLKNSSE